MVVLSNLISETQSGLVISLSSVCVLGNERFYAVFAMFFFSLDFFFLLSKLFLCCNAMFFFARLIFSAIIVFFGGLM